MPSWPKLLSPQHLTPLLVAMTHVCELPKAIAMTETPEGSVKVEGGGSKSGLGIVRVRDITKVQGEKGEAQEGGRDRQREREEGREEK